MAKLKYLIFILIALSVPTFAQRTDVTQESSSSADSVKRSYVHLLHADVTKYNK